MNEKFDKTFNIIVCMLQPHIWMKTYSLFKISMHKKLLILLKENERISYRYLIMYKHPNIYVLNTKVEAREPCIETRRNDRIKLPKHRFIQRNINQNSYLWSK